MDTPTHVEYGPWEDDRGSRVEIITDIAGSTVRSERFLRQRRTATSVYETWYGRLYRKTWEYEYRTAEEPS